MNKKTLVLGASQNTERYSNKAVRALRSYQHEVIAVGAKPGQIEDVKIDTEMPKFETIHTVTMYLNPSIQQQYYKQILDLKPQRIIFNPGAENPELALLAEKNRIYTENACTLVLLNTGQY